MAFTLQDLVNFFVTKGKNACEKCKEYHEKKEKCEKEKQEEVRK